MCVCVLVLWRSKDYWVPRTELISSGLAADTFPPWSTLPDLSLFESSTFISQNPAGLMRRVHWALLQLFGPGLWSAPSFTSCSSSLWQSTQPRDPGKMSNTGDAWPQRDQFSGEVFSRELLWICRIWNPWRKLHLMLLWYRPFMVLDQVKGTDTGDQCFLPVHTWGFILTGSYVLGRKTLAS